MTAAVALPVLKFVICALAVFTALGLGCAVKMAIERDRAGSPFDPDRWPHGDQPGFTRAQLDEIATASLQRAARDPLRRSFGQKTSASALPRIADGGCSDVPSGAAAVRKTFGRRRA